MLKQTNGSPSAAFHFFFRSFDSSPKMSGAATRVGSNGSFMLYVPEGADLGTQAVFNLISHEMIHIFVKGAESDWYVEGIADYLSAILPYQGGFTTRSSFINLINNGAAQYYTNSIRLASDSAYNSELKWKTTNSWILSYSRGMLYFANLDAKLNSLSGKHPTVLSLILEMNKASEVGEASWENILQKNVGEWAVNDYKTMLTGKLFRPELGAYDKDLILKKISTGIFDLGFGGSLGVNKGQKVTKLDLKSNAAKAGLKEGDVIIETLNLFPYYSEYDKPITITVSRDGKILKFTYQPHGETTEGYKWSL